MIKKRIVFIVESFVLLALVIFIPAVFTKLFLPSFLGTTIRFHHLKQLVLVGAIAMIFKRLLTGYYIRHPFLDRVAEKIAASQPLRTQILRTAAVLIGILVVTHLLHPLDRGLTGRYYDNVNLEGEPLQQTLDRVFTLQRMQAMFPERTENYSIEWDGTLIILRSGRYHFSTISDDGSELWIDGQMVVDNRGFHGFIEQTGDIHLDRGAHTLKLCYMQGGGAADLRAFWNRSGSSRRLLSEALLFPHTPTLLRFSIGMLLDLLRIVAALGLWLLIACACLLWISSRHHFISMLQQSRFGPFLHQCRLWLFLSPDGTEPGPPVPQHNTFVPYVLAFLGYIGISLVWTYPLIAKFSTELFGLGGDRYVQLWNMWWMKKALLELHTNPFFTKYLFYPVGVNLAFHDFSPLNALLSVPLQSFFSLGEIYNILFLSTFILGGFGCFLLVRYLTGDHLAAFVSGLIFAFWGGRVYYVDHLSLASIQWFPYCALYSIKTIRERSYRNPLLAGIFFTFNALSCSTYAVYMSMFAAFLFLYSAVTERRQFFTLRCFTRLLVLGFVFLLLASPLLYPMFQEIFAGEDYMNSPMFVDESASPNVVFFPNVNHAILGRYVRAWYEKAGLPVQWGLAGGSFIGYTVLILCLYTGFKIRHTQSIFWVIGAVGFLLLAFGPDLMIFSKHYTWIPLPHQLLHHLPILKILRVPIRFMVLAMFCCSVVAGYACREMFRRLRFKKIGFVLLALLILFEFLRVYFVSPIQETPEFYQKLAQDPEDYAILEITTLMNWYPSSARSSLFQITHQKRLFHGHITRVPFDTSYQVYALYPLLDDLFTQPEEYLTSAPNPGISLQNRKAAILAALSFYNVRYVTLYYDYWYGTYWDNRQRLQEILGPPQGEEDGMALFKAEQTPLTETIAFPGYGTGPLIFQDHAIPQRQTARDTEIKILNVDKRAIRLQFQAQNYAAPAEEQLEVLMNGTLLTTVTIGDWTDIALPPLPLIPGENTLKLRMPGTTFENWKHGMYLRNITVTFEE